MSNKRAEGDVSMSTNGIVQFSPCDESLEQYRWQGERSIALRVGAHHLAAVLDIARGGYVYIDDASHMLVSEDAVVAYGAAVMAGCADEFLSEWCAESSAIEVARETGCDCRYNYSLWPASDSAVPPTERDHDAAYLEIGIAVGEGVHGWRWLGCSRCGHVQRDRKGEAPAWLIANARRSLTKRKADMMFDSLVRAANAISGRTAVAAPAAPPMCECREYLDVAACEMELACEDSVLRYVPPQRRERARRTGAWEELAVTIHVHNDCVSDLQCSCTGCWTHGDKASTSEPQWAIVVA